MSDTERVPTLDEIRKAIFNTDSLEPQVIPYWFRGVKLDFKQPTVEETIGASSSNDDGRDNRFVKLMIEHSYVSGTTTKVFTLDDYEMLVNMPMSSEFSKILEVINGALGFKAEDEAKN